MRLEAVVFSRGMRPSRPRLTRLAPCLPSPCSFVIAAATLNIAARYVAIILMICGMHGNFNVLLAWYSGVFQRPRQRRAVAVAFINSLFVPVSHALSSVPYQRSC